MHPATPPPGPTTTPSGATPSGTTPSGTTPPLAPGGPATAGPDAAGPDAAGREAAAAATHRSGLALGLGAYVLWGVMPLYFPLLEPAGPVEIIAHRVVWSLLFCLVVLLATRQWGTFTAAFRSGRTLATLTVAGALVALNWLVFVYGVLSGHTIDTALGYYINPLLTVVLAVLALGERLRRAQWVALGVGAVAVVVITAGVGRLPWIALALAGTFGLYGLIKNRVGRTVPAVTSLAVETTVLAPFALGYLLLLQASGDAAWGANGGWHMALLASAGVITAVPLLLFGGAARRLPLSVLGMLQYVGPTMQFAIGVLVLGEEMPAARWAGFALVWLALVILTVDGLRAGRAERIARRVARARPGRV
ncbi:EamA family transporter RarD [Cellulomonas fimi]|uniref:EamA family transporter RarD n=1 Tax=Cellulomonas fimi TaxID=1708 RepID=A0A7Y0QF98_CELFI|nr:EamA family transporter RarD [Cellulomonas fimi]NMR18841.1 EamA family transporter RarD [Cellulomonas fimi]